MLKNKAWIVALLAALTMVFFGCIEPSDKLDDGSGVDKSLKEVEFTGEDIVIKKIGSGESAVVKNTFEVDDAVASSVGFAFEFPEEVKGKSYWKVGVEIKLISKDITPDFISFNAKDSVEMTTDVLAFGHTQQYHGELKIGEIKDKELAEPCSSDCFKYTADSCKEGATGYVEYPFNKLITNNLIAFQYNPYAGDITTPGWSSSGKATFKVEVTKIVFIPAAGNTDLTVNIAAIAGVRPPAAGAAPVAAITASDQFTGTVAWKDADGAAVGATFDISTVYTATITLNVREGFTLTGVEADFFTVAGATSVKNAAGSGVITAVFPETADTVGPTDEEKFDAVVGLKDLTNHWGTSGSIVADADTGVISRSAGSSSLFSVDVPSALTITETDTIKVTWAALAEGQVKLTAKKPGGSTDLATSTYIDVTGAADVGFLEGSFSLPAERYTDGDGDFEAPDKLTFQDNSSTDSVWKLKIVSITVE